MHMSARLAQAATPQSPPSVTTALPCALECVCSSSARAQAKGSRDTTHDAWQMARGWHTSLARALAKQPDSLPLNPAQTSEEVHESFFWKRFASFSFAYRKVKRRLPEITKRFGATAAASSGGVRAVSATVGMYSRGDGGLWRLCRPYLRFFQGKNEIHRRLQCFAAERGQDEKGHVRGATERVHDQEEHH